MESKHLWIRRDFKDHLTQHLKPFHHFISSHLTILECGHEKQAVMLKTQESLSKKLLDKPKILMTSEKQITN